MSLLLAAVLAIATLAMIGWHAYWALYQGRLIPGFTLFYVLFSLGLALPYLATLVLLVRRERDGLAMAFCTALLNAVWMVPLGAFAFLLIGFARENVDQVHQTYALALAGLLQLALLAVAGAGLWYPRARVATAAPPPASTAWALAFLLPFLASSASWTYFAWQQDAIKASKALATSNDSAAQETMEALRKCLAERGERGYPEKLEECPDVAQRTSSASGFQFEFLRALPGADGRSGAYFICARPIAFRVTGHITLVADASGTYHGYSSHSTQDAQPTCASVLDIERAIVFCAYERAAREPARGYPERLADIAPCVSALRTRTEIGADRVTTDENRQYVYLAGAPDAGDRVSRFRIYRFYRPAGSALWIDDQFRESERRIPKDPPVTDELAAVAEGFEPGCAQGRGAHCFAAARELERAPGVERDVVQTAALYERACTLGYRDGCRNAADMYKRGRKARVPTLQRQPPVAAPRPDLPADPPRALALYHRGCELDDHNACFIAARLLAAGEGVPADQEKAFTLFARLCERGAWAEACWRAAGFSSRQQKDYLRRACAFGESKACGPAWN